MYLLYQYTDPHTQIPGTFILVIFQFPLNEKTRVKKS